MADHHHEEPAHQPPAPADRLDQGQQLPVEVHAPDHLVAATTDLLAAAEALVWASRHRLRPAGLAVLLALANGADTQADLVAATGLSTTGVRAALSKLTGRGRWLSQSNGVPGLAEPLAHRRPHPHGNNARQQQYRLTPAGSDLVRRLLGMPQPAQDDRLDHPGQPDGLT